MSKFQNFKNTKENTVVNFLSAIKPTPCKTISSSHIHFTKHGIVKHVVSLPNTDFYKKVTR